MKTTISAALIALLAAPAVAAGVPAGPAGAIAHFNQDVSNPNHQVSLAAADLSRTVVSTRRAGTQEEAYAHFNSDAQTLNDLRGLQGATAYGYAPSVGADTFAVIRAE
ncbi:hypothetical protein [Jannaschia rubra]|uniref:Uncharacterized protein n=1 Tax=Jannaschia rubra TaxID=282197 RepID=A0A0M6XUH4_9RHOB|nr:hypothetical protein [Jannaschia rubra]CTQ34267.1 hypothetical protein JAN5088_03061 [Jannaschia rubra]SFG19152.1 hypothetical protein SAMN04488517_10376 [Jannaschia rubra]